MKQYTDDQIQEMAFELGLCSPHGNPNPETYSFVKGFKAALSLIEKDEQQSLGCGDAERYKQALIGCFGFILRLESGTKTSMDTGIIDDANGMLVAKALYYESKKESVPNSK